MQQMNDHFFRDLRYRKLIETGRSRQSKYSMSEREVVCWNREIPMVLAVCKFRATF